MKKILFPFEIGNPIYKEAYVYAVKFSRNLNAELTLLNVFNIDIDDDITKERYDRLVKDNWLKAYNEVSRYNKFYFDNHIRVDTGLKIRIEYRFIHGKLLHELKEILREELFDLVVLPVSDNTEFNKKQHQIIRNEIFEKNRAALLIIPFKGVFNPIKNIVFATDLKKLKIHELYLNDVLKYARIFNSNIHFLHISPKEKATLPKETDVYRTLKRITENNKKYVFTSLYGKDVVDSIQKYIKKNKADLLAIVQHERFLLDTLHHKSVSGEVSLRSKIPVLIMREKHDEHVL